MIAKRCNLQGLLRNDLKFTANKCPNIIILEGCKCVLRAFQKHPKNSSDQPSQNQMVARRSKNAFLNRSLILKSITFRPYQKPKTCDCIRWILAPIIFEGPCKACIIFENDKPDNVNLREPKPVFHSFIDFFHANAPFHSGGKVHAAFFFVDFEP